ncbi:MAG TPA: FAD:protein FMN transferase [Clostridiaceae bacterium]|nr:FAD:protein FMN transferase [Clostridiaceae bacterium]
MAILLAILLFAILILNTGCAFGNRTGNKRYTKYSYEFFGAFDSIIQFMGYAENGEQFEILAKKGQARFEELHKLFDIYHDYAGINNIKTINDNAGVKPVEVRQEIIDLIQFSKEWYSKTGGVVNIALGPVLSIWHTYREEGRIDPSKARIPDLELLKQALEKTDIDKVEVDPVKKTVFLREKGMSLDVGAVAKGFATEIVARELISEGFTSFIISSGGNIRTVGKPMDGNRSKWSIGIQNPDGNPLLPKDNPLDTVYITENSVVTSGDYQRYYEVNGQRLHHLIDPNTLMPAGHYRAVTVVTKDSGLADFLSSALFILPYEKSRALADSLEGVDALWIMKDGSIVATDNMKNSLRKMGGASDK